MAPGAGEEWGPLEKPAGFDPKRAALTLSQVPDDPPAPGKVDAAAAAELPRQALQHLAEARRLFAEQRYSETMQQLERALRYNMECQEAHRLMALAGLLSGNMDRAGGSAEKALALAPDDLAARYVRGRVADKSGRPADAIREYRSALKSRPAGSDESYRLLVNFFLGSLLFDEGYYQAAIEQLTAFEGGVRALSEKVADNPELASIARVHRGAAAIKVARAQGYLGNYAAAAESLRVAVVQSPKDTALRGEYVRMLGRAGRSGEAAAEAERLVADTNGGKDAVELLLAVHRRAGHPERALPAIQKIAAAQPDNVELWKLYVDALAAARKFDEAVAALNELVSRHPGATDSRWRLVQMTRERGEWPAWLTALAQHLCAAPAEADKVRQELSRVPEGTARGMLAEASRPAGRRLLPAEPADARAAAALDCLLAWLAAQVGESASAADFLRSAGRRAPGFLPVTTARVESLVRQCRWQEALDAAGPDADRKETSAGLERALAEACDGLDRLPQAAEHYRKALELDKTDVDSMLRLGRLHERAGQSREAERQYQAAVAAAENDMRAREALTRFYIREGERNKAVQAAAEMQRLAPQDPASLRVHALMSQLLQADSDPQAYVEAIGKAVAGDPDDVQSRQDLIDGLLLVRDYTAAHEQAVELCHRQPCSAENRDLLARTLMGLLDFAGAVRELQAATAIFPHREVLLQRLGQAALVEQEYDAAISAYRRLLDAKETQPRHDDYQRALFYVYRQAGRFDEARTTIESWLTGARGDDVNRLRSYLLMIDAAAGDNERYVARCREWLKAEPDDDMLRTLLLGSAGRPGEGDGPPSGLIGLGRYDEALILAIQWLGEEPTGNAARNAALARSLRGTARLLTILQAAGRHDQAIEVARSVVASGRSPDERAILQRLLFEVYFNAGRNDEAIALARELVADSERTGLDFDLRLISLLSRARRFDEAYAHANRLLGDLEKLKAQLEENLQREGNAQRRENYRATLGRLRAQQTMILRTSSYAYQRGGQREVAEQRLQAAYKLDPRDEGVNNDLGYLMADMNRDLDQAERMIRIAVAEEPLTAAYHDSLGWVLYKKGRFQEAHRWLSRVIHMENGQDPVVYDHLADTEWRLGMKEQAVARWRASLELYNRQSASGMSEVEEDLPDRVKAKLAAVEAGKPPPVAAVGPATRPER
ncbi:MAG: tetratricopeptide repeat protein [Phycisphaerae bacterium]